MYVRSRSRRFGLRLLRRIARIRRRFAVGLRRRYGRRRF